MRIDLGEAGRAYDLLVAYSETRGLQSGREQGRVREVRELFEGLVIMRGWTLTDSQYTLVQRTDDCELMCRWCERLFTSSSLEGVLTSSGAGRS
jgi:hypothetical protein